MGPLMFALIMLIVLETAAFISFIVIRNKRVNELESEIKLLHQLTSEESKNDDWVVLMNNLNNYSARIIKRLNKIIAQSYQRLMPKWSLDCFGEFLDELNLIKDKEKKNFIRNIFNYALGLLDAKILADIITNYLKEENSFDEKNARIGLVPIMSIILKEGNAGQLATCFSRELEKNIKELLDSPEIQDDEKILIHAGSIKIKKMLTA